MLVNAIVLAGIGVYGWQRRHVRGVPIWLMLNASLSAGQVALGARTGWIWGGLATANAPARLNVLRSLVPYAVPSPTALDAVLTRLVLAQARRDPPPDLAEVTALEAVPALRPAIDQPEAGSELTTRPPARLPA